MSEEKDGKLNTKKTLLVLIFSSIVALSVLWLLKREGATRVHLELAVDRLDFVTGGRIEREIFNAEFRSIFLQGFTRLELQPLESADEEVFEHSLVLSPSDPALLPSVRIDMATFQSGLPQLTIRAFPESHVTIDAAMGELSFSISGDKAEFSQFELDIPPGEWLELRGDHVVVEGKGVRKEGEPLLRLRLSPSEPVIRVQSGKAPLYSKIYLPVGVADVFPEAPIPVSSLAFMTLNRQNEWQTNLVQEGRIIYPELPARGTVTIPETALFAMEDLREFSIEKMETRDSGDLELHMSGVAGQIKSRRGDFVEDYRLSVMDRLQESRFFMVLLYIWPLLLSAWAGLQQFYRRRMDD